MPLAPPHPTVKDLPRLAPAGSPHRPWIRSSAPGPPPRTNDRSDQDFSPNPYRFSSSSLQAQLLSSRRTCSDGDWSGFSPLQPHACTIYTRPPRQTPAVSRQRRLERAQLHWGLSPLLKLTRTSRRAPAGSAPRPRTRSSASGSPSPVQTAHLTSHRSTSAMSAGPVLPCSMWPLLSASPSCKAGPCPVPPRNHFARAHGALVLRTSRRQDMAYYPAELQSPTPCRSKLLPATVPPAPLQRRPAHSCDGVPPASSTGQTRPAHDPAPPRPGSQPHALSLPTQAVRDRSIGPGPSSLIPAADCRLPCYIRRAPSSASRLPPARKLLGSHIGTHTSSVPRRHRCASARPRVSPRFQRVGRAASPTGAYSGDTRAISRGRPGHGPRLLFRPCNPGRRHAVSDRLHGSSPSAPPVLPMQPHFSPGSPDCGSGPRRADRLGIRLVANPHLWLRSLATASL